MDTVSEQDKTSSRSDTPSVVVPFLVGVDEISVSNGGTFVHYKDSQIVLCLRAVVGKGMKTE